MAWWLSEALSWLSNPRKVYDPLRVAKPTLIAKYDVSLSTPVSDVEYFAQGNVIQITDWHQIGSLAGVNPTIRVNERDYPAITLRDGTTLFIPTYRFFLSVPNGLRGTFSILVGRAALNTNGIGIALTGQNFLSTAFFRRCEAIDYSIAAGGSVAITPTGALYDVYVRKILITNPTSSDLWISHSATGDQYPFPAYRELDLSFSCAWKFDKSTVSPGDRLYVGNPTSSAVVVKAMIFYSISGDFV